MNKVITYIYFFLIIINVFLFFNTPFKNYKNKWFYKNISMISGFLLFFINIFLNNEFLNKYLLPILLFLNILVLLVVTYNHGFNIKNYLVSLPLLYLLFTFNYKDFELKNGLLLRPNKKWIYSHVIILIIYYLFSDFIYSKIWLSLLILYPLLFPIKEFFIHRLILLSLAVILNYKFKLYIA